MPGNNSLDSNRSALAMVPAGTPGTTVIIGRPLWPAPVWAVTWCTPLQHQHPKVGDKGKGLNGRASVN